MSDEVLIRVLSVLEESPQPIKAREITRIINSAGGIRVTKTEVNSCLYRNRVTCDLVINNDYGWSLYPWGDGSSKEPCEEPGVTFDMVLRPSKETENKLRWATWIDADQTRFQLYIPKDYVPEPWPGRIWVTISPVDEDLDERVISNHTYLSLNGIESIVRLLCDHTKTQRFRPLGDPSRWFIGEPYIPFSLVPQDADALIVHVEFDPDSVGEFIDVPTFKDD